MSDRLAESSVIRVDWPFQEGFEKILENKLTSLESSEQVNIEVDCSQMNSVTSLDIRSLWEAKLCCDDRQLSLILVSVSEKLRRVIENLDLNELFVVAYITSPEGVQKDSDATVDESLAVLEFHAFLTQEAIHDATSNVRSFLRKKGAPNFADFEIATILYEVITNIRLHSTLDYDEKISISVNCNKTRIEIIVQDSGVAFDPSQGGLPLDIAEAITSKKTRRFGLYMINKLSDKITYSRVENKFNLLRFVKEW